MKPLQFIGSCLDDLKKFPDEPRRAVGHELWQVQRGLMPRDFKPMKSIGPGCHEIRIHVEGEWRVIYVATFDKAVHVLHVFRKKSQATSRRDIRIAQQRYRVIGEYRS
jgi:phage-related protein